MMSNNVNRNNMSHWDALGCNGMNMPRTHVQYLYIRINKCCMVHVAYILFYVTGRTETLRCITLSGLAVWWDVVGCSRGWHGVW